MKVSVKITEGPQKVELPEIHDGESLIIGRRPDSGKAILDGRLSGRHMSLTVVDGQCIVEDLNSTNGTYVNGNKLTERHVLQPGDVILGGDTKLAVDLSELVQPEEQDLFGAHTIVMDIHAFEIENSGSAKNDAPSDSGGGKDKSVRGHSGHSLLDRAWENDPEAWQEIRRLYAPIIYRWCRRWGVPRETTPPIVVRILEAAANQARQFDPKAEGQTFRGMLWAIARYHAGESCRTLQVMNIPERYPDHVAKSIVQDETTRLLHSAVEAIRGEFSEVKWQVFERTVVGSETASEVASELPMTKREVREAKGEILRRLRFDYRHIIGIL